MIIERSRIALLKWARGTTTVAEAQLSLTGSSSLPVEGFCVSQDERNKMLAMRQAVFLTPMLLPRATIAIEVGDSDQRIVGAEQFLSSSS